MTDYSQGKIYKLYIKGFEEVCYIGSTINTLEWRFNHHKHQAKNPKQNKTGASVLFEDENEVEIALVENYPCETKEQLETRERYWIEQHSDCVNKNIPTRGWKERWLKNREHNIALHKQWVAANQDHVAEYRKGRATLEKQQAKERYDAGYKDVRNERKREKATCEICNKQMNKNSLWLHKKTIHKENSEV
jgi:hypothetical protein